MQDEFYCCSAIANKLLSQRAEGRANLSTLPEKPAFSGKETEIIRLICQQYCSKEIALKLNTTSRAVEGIRERIQAKIGAKNMAGIAVYAIQNGIYSLG